MAKSKLDYPIYLFNEGTNCEAYKLFKLSYVARGGRKNWRFRCWAPRAKSVSVVGDFNKWTHNKNPMTPIGGGIWECCIAGLKKYDLYKFSIEGVDGVIRQKADPYALHTETPPATASKVYDLNGFNWTDKEYLANNARKNMYQSPLNIYEVHLGSWKRHADGNYLSYLDLIDTLIPYVKEMGYTHIELLPVTEHPYEGSWGYQVSSLYAPTSRYGTPHDFMAFINACHKEGIGVIMDFVLSHFPKDAFGLYEFDGAPLYEYEDPLKREHKGWGTRSFDFGRKEVQSFLMSAATFWFDYYHIDGMRLDAVASMLYLNYDRGEGEWRPNEYGSIYNLEAIEFIKKLNQTVLTKYPSAMMIAEESTAFPLVTMPPAVGGLGFNFKWNMGWMNDILTYESIDPFFRKGSHDKLTFSITYAFSENYILPFSHDEVVHGKASMISKMKGNYAEKFSALKALYVYQFTHPGKKLNYMGNEFGQFIEWDYKKELDWMLLAYESHAKLKDFCRALNHLYRTEPPMYMLDSSPEGFRWIVVDDRIQNVIAYCRIDANRNKIIVIISFSDVLRRNYRFGVPDKGNYKVILNTNKKEFGGDTAISDVYASEEIPSHGFQQSLNIHLEGNSALIFKLIKEE
jgi:1,4-alpha-glucan branching enzyme